MTEKFSLSLMLMSYVMHALLSVILLFVLLCAGISGVKKARGNPSESESASASAAAAAAQDNFLPSIQLLIEQDDLKINRVFHTDFKISDVTRLYPGLGDVKFSASLSPFLDQFKNELVRTGSVLY